ncbi:MAG: hypothetical protein WA726_12860 [Acidimicrobiia bacterium]
MSTLWVAVVVVVVGAVVVVVELVEVVDDVDVVVEEVEDVVVDGSALASTCVVDTSVVTAAARGSLVSNWNSSARAAIVVPMVVMARFIGVPSQ